MKVTIGPGVTLSAKEIEESYLFQDWRRRDLASVVEVVVTHAQVWADTVQNMQMLVVSSDHPWPQTTVLRSETVDVLTQITDGTRNWLVFVSQHRVASGCRVVSNPAGGRNWTEGPIEAGLREVREELGLDLPEANDQEESPLNVVIEAMLPQPLLVSPGYINERVYMLRATITVDPNNVDEFVKSLHGKFTGVEAEGEAIVLAVIPVEQAWQVACAQDPDAKTLLSLKLAGIS